MRRQYHDKKTRIVKDETGAVMMEYALMVALIAAVVFATVKIFGINLNAQILKIAGAIP